MNTFTLVRPQSYRDAARAFESQRSRADVRLPMYKAGGMDVLDHMKEGLVEPDVLIDVHRLRGVGGDEPAVRADGGRIAIEATATLSDIASSMLLRTSAQALRQTCESAATPQVRNVATLAGNLLQRPRCWYYRNEQFDCLKKGGNRCYAREGEHRYHAIFGGGPCHIVHPSNAAVALYVLDGRVHYLGANESADGEMPITELYNDRHDWVSREHTLPGGAVITHISIAPATHSGFNAIKEKQSFDWPLAMAAAALDVRDSVIQSARLCAGAVAPWPWRLEAVERALAGVRTDDRDRIAAACAHASDGAQPMRDNAYKTALLPVAVKRAIAAALEHST